MKKIIATIFLGLLFSISAVAQSVPAYLIGASASLGDVESKLKANGFEVLATTNNVVTITNDELKKTNTYVATLQVYVGMSDVRVQNPDYFGKAYLGDKYKAGQFSQTNEALTKALGSLKNSPEALDADELPDYHFMMGMPYFDEPITVANKPKIYEKVQGNANVLYSLSLPNGTLLVGHKLSKKTGQFLKTLKQTQNSQILPYEALVFSNKVSMMNPKFYLALSLPKLSLGEFMKISEIPGKIEEDIENAYK
jgi:hypothetical protein